MRESEGERDREKQREREAEGEREPLKQNSRVRRTCGGVASLGRNLS